jgi:hypothetical protein
VKERPEPEIPGTYVDSPLKIGLFFSMTIYIIGAIALIKYLLEKAGGRDKMPLMFPILFMVFFFFVPILSNSKKSIFEKTKKPIEAFKGLGTVGSVSAFLKLIIYDDAIEVRVFFHSYLIPYNKMEKISHTVGTLLGELCIRSNLPRVPKKIVFMGLRADALARIIETHRLKQDDTHGRRVSESKNKRSNIIVDESTRLKRITSQNKTFTIKMVFIVFLAEIIALSGFGIIYNNLMILNNKHKQNVKIFKYSEYKSISARAPKKFQTVIVEYDLAGVVKKETLINFLGDSTIISYKDGTPDRSSWTAYSTIVMFVFPVLGILLWILSYLLKAIISRKRSDGDSNELTFPNKLEICGLIMVFSVFIIGPIEGLASYLV